MHVEWGNTLVDENAQCIAVYCTRGVQEQRAEVEQNYEKAGVAGRAAVQGAWDEKAGQDVVFVQCST